MRLKTILIATASLACAASLTACMGLGIGSGTSTATNDLFKTILTDPNCAHDDKIAVTTGAGGIPASVVGSAERHCPGPPAGGVTVGKVVAPAPPAPIQ